MRSVVLRTHYKVNVGVEAMKHALRDGKEGLYSKLRVISGVRILRHSEVSISLSISGKRDDSVTWDLIEAALNE